MNKTSLLSLAAVLATSAILCESSKAAVHREPDLGNALEQRIERMGTKAWALLDSNGITGTTPDSIARAWGNGGGRAWGNGGRAWGNGGRGFANGGGGGGFANGYRGGFANW